LSPPNPPRYATDNRYTNNYRKSLWLKKNNLCNRRLQLCSMQNIVKTHSFQPSFPSADKDSLDCSEYRDADKSLARPGRKQARKHVRDARYFNNIETRAVIKIFFLQDKAPKEIHAILTETSACFLPGRAKDLSSPLYIRTSLLYS